MMFYNRPAPNAQTCRLCLVSMETAKQLIIVESAEFKLMLSGYLKGTRGACPTSPGCGYC